MNKVTYCQKILLLIGGFDSKTAKQCTSSEIQKLLIMSTMVLIPTIIGYFSASYAIYLVSGNQQIALLGGAGWAIVILLIDRAIMGYGRPGEINFGFLGRIALAVTIGFGIAEPVVLLVFNDAIAEQQHNELQSIVDDVAKKHDAKIKSINELLKEEGAKVDRLKDAHVSEADGTGGSKVRNAGPIWRMKYDAYLDGKTSFNALKKEKYQEIADIKNVKIEEINQAKNVNANGLLGSMRALHAIKDPIVLYATWGLRFFFFFIELIPIFIKISPVSGKKLYYHIIDQNDDECLEVHKAKSHERMVVLLREERLRNLQRTLKTMESEMQSIVNTKHENAVYLMKQLTSMVDKKINFQLKVIKTVKDDAFQKQLLDDLDRIFSDFTKSIDYSLNKQL